MRWNRQINLVAQIDRLPSQNSLEGMFLLRSCWDCVDIFTARALHCKRLTKVSYLTMMILGSATSVLTNFSLNRPDLLSCDTLNSVVVILSLVTSFLAGVITFLNPKQKWQQLRGAALAK